MKIESGKDLTFGRFADRLRISTDTLRATVNELGLELPMKIVKGGQSRTVTPETGELIRKHLNVIYPEELDQYLEQGHVPSNKIPVLLGVTKETYYKCMNVILPEWQDEFPTFSDKGRKVHLLPAEVFFNVARYINLEPERQMLGVWRSMRTRKILSLEALASDIPKSLEWAFLALKIQQASDVVSLSKEDEKMLEGIIETSPYIKVAVLSLYRNPDAIKTLEETVSYMADTIPIITTSFGQDSEEFLATLMNKTYDFVTQK